jgi:hypothetical protein
MGITDGLSTLRVMLPCCGEVKDFNTRDIVFT